MKLGLIDVTDADAWLNDNRWIVMGYDGGFAQYLEQCYFTPGTPKNAEFEPQIGAKLGEYEIAYKQSNLQDKWQPAYAILRNSNATIKDRYHSDTYQYSYWLFDEDKIYRKKLKLKTAT